MVTVGLISSRKLIRTALRSLLSELPVAGGLGVLFDVDTFADASVQLIGSKPDVLLIDCGSGLRGCLSDVVHRVRQLSPNTRCVLLADHAEEEFEIRAARGGAWGVVTEQSDPVLMQEAIERVIRGEMWYSRETLGKAVQSLLQHKAPSDSAVDKLTPREVEVVTLLAQGCHNKEIAQRLFLSENTVRRYTETIYRKLGVNSRLEIAVWYHKRAVNS